MHRFNGSINNDFFIDDANTMFPMKSIRLTEGFIMIYPSMDILCLSLELRMLMRHSARIILLLWILFTPKAYAATDVLFMIHAFVK